jgi:signal transduction histidine kinase
MQWLSLLSISLMAIVIFVSFIISTFVVNRTNRIATTAKIIMDTGDLSKRIAIDERWDDLSNMAYVLNAFLARVEDLMHGIRRVSDNVAHDLRTPLTRLVNNLESLRAHDAISNDESARLACESMIDETTRLLETFNAMLRITRVETGAMRQDFTTLALDNILSDIIELYEPLAEQKNIQIQHDISPQSCTGDANLLFQAFANILDNALKFTPDGGTVAISLQSAGERTLCVFRDTGPGIAEADRLKVFDRFYRADSSRTHEGNGLGLSLVAAIIALHNGQITLADANPGLCVQITL